jgi:ATP-dependent DNA ligase
MPSGNLFETDELGRTNFTALIYRSETARYFAFDLLWLSGRDLRAIPLVSRKDELTVPGRRFANH